MEVREFGFCFYFLFMQVKSSGVPGVRICGKALYVVYVIRPHKRFDFALFCLNGCPGYRQDPVPGFLNRKSVHIHGSTRVSILFLLPVQVAVHQPVRFRTEITVLLRSFLCARFLDNGEVAKAEQQYFRKNLDQIFPKTSCSALIGNIPVADFFRFAQRCDRFSALVFSNNGEGAKVEQHMFREISQPDLPPQKTKTVRHWQTPRWGKSSAGKRSHPCAEPKRIYGRINRGQ